MASGYTKAEPTGAEIVALPQVPVAAAVHGGLRRSEGSEMIKLTEAQREALVYAAELDAQGVYATMAGRYRMPARNLERQGLLRDTGDGRLFGITEEGLAEVALLRHCAFLQDREGMSSREAVIHAEANREAIVATARAMRPRPAQMTDGRPCANTACGRSPEANRSASSEWVNGSVQAQNAPIGVQLWPTISAEHAPNFTLRTVEVVRSAGPTYVRWTYENGTQRMFYPGEYVAVKTAQPLEVQA
jgi:hypothetical protein